MHSHISGNYAGKDYIVCWFTSLEDSEKVTKAVAKYCNGDNIIVKVVTSNFNGELITFLEESHGTSTYINEIPVTLVAFDKDGNKMSLPENIKSKFATA
ncbi:hypothetical protein IWW39_004230 [Coemansia spiralis]|uniref:Uncharacterized protein n=1 Tax=Coemansia spiralis TaxID=417178 RepID=A0A9W8L3U2_9FUNG|nr:hypothetical protein IWW39_004230 [Coemansia spiralis]